jgi:hypothetical protein
MQTLNFIKTTIPLGLIVLCAGCGKGSGSAVDQGKAPFQLEPGTRLDKIGECSVPEGGWAGTMPSGKDWLFTKSIRIKPKGSDRWFQIVAVTSPKDPDGKVIPGTEGKALLKIEVDSGIGTSNPTWLEQPYEIHDDKGETIFRHSK